MRLKEFLAHHRKSAARLVCPSWVVEDPPVVTATPFPRMKQRKTRRPIDVFEPVAHLRSIFFPGTVKHATSEKFGFSAAHSCATATGVRLARAFQVSAAVSLPFLLRVPPKGWGRKRLVVFAPFFYRGPFQGQVGVSKLPFTTPTAPGGGGGVRGRCQRFAWGRHKMRRVLTAVCARLVSPHRSGAATEAGRSRRRGAGNVHHRGRPAMACRPLRPARSLACFPRAPPVIQIFAAGKPSRQIDHVVVIHCRTTPTIILCRCLHGRLLQWP